jgi:pimeloyl-ACP methyl ester carboxylesterase
LLAYSVEKEHGAAGISGLHLSAIVGVCRRTTWAFQEIEIVRQDRMRFKNFAVKSVLVVSGLVLISGSAAARSAQRISVNPSKAISFKSSKDGIVLHGALSRPKQKSKGAVLLIAGSGKVDRDETTPSNRTFSGKTEKLFLQVSDALNEAGFTTFRYDKRGVLDSNGSVDETVWLKADRDHLISDANDAAKTLSVETGTPATRLILLGHSEGTIIATEVALLLGSSVRAVLLLGAQARSMKDMLHFQIVESRSKQTSGVGDAADPESEYQRALEMIENSSETLAPDGKPITWYRQYLAAPANSERLKQVIAKKFVFQGELDPQTPIDEADKFVSAGVKDLTIFRYPNLGHGFSPDKNGKPTLGPIDQRVLTDLKLVVSKLE